MTNTTKPLKCSQPKHSYVTTEWVQETHTETRKCKHCGLVKVLFPKDGRVGVMYR